MTLLKLSLQFAALFDGVILMVELFFLQLCSATRKINRLKYPNPLSNQKGVGGDGGMRKILQLF